MGIYSQSKSVFHTIADEATDLQLLMLTANLSLQQQTTGRCNCLQVLPLRCDKCPVILTHTHTQSHIHACLHVACKTCGTEMAQVLV